MNWDAIGALGEAFGAFAVFISLIYLAIQVSQNTGQARQSAERLMLDELGRALQSVAQNGNLADVYVRGLQDFYALTLPERSRFSGFVGHVFRIFQGLQSQHEAGTLDPQSWAGVRGLMLDLLAYPGARQYFDIRKHHFSPGFRRFVEEKLSEGVGPPRLFGEERDGGRPGSMMPGIGPGLDMEAASEDR